MREADIDISHTRIRAVFDALKSGKRFHYVVTVCDETSAWSFPDPSALSGTIKTKIEQWCDEGCPAQTA